jgi:hypothetical protein
VKSSSSSRLSHILQALGAALPLFAVFRLLLLESASGLPKSFHAMTAVASSLLFLGTWVGAVYLWILLRRQGRSNYLTLVLLVLAGPVLGWIYLLFRSPTLCGDRASIWNRSVLNFAFMMQLLLLVFFGVHIRQQNPQASPPSWMPWALLASAAYLLYGFGSLVFFTKAIDGEMGRRIRERGKDPRVILHMLGVSVWLSFAILAFILTLAGLDLAFLYGGCVLSFLGMAWWSWWWRARYGEPREAPGRAPGSSG